MRLLFWCVVGILHDCRIFEYQNRCLVWINKVLVCDTLGLCSCVPVTQSYRCDFSWRNRVQLIACARVSFICVFMYSMPTRCFVRSVVFNSNMLIRIAERTIGTCYVVRTKICKVNTLSKCQCVDKERVYDCKNKFTHKCLC